MAIGDRRRKILQITGGSETNPIIVLCDDDSIWYYNKQSDTWTKVPDVPDSSEEPQ